MTLGEKVTHIFNRVPVNVGNLPDMLKLVDTKIGQEVQVGSVGDAVFDVYQFVGGDSTNSNNWKVVTNGSYTNSESALTYRTTLETVTGSTVVKVTKVEVFDIEGELTKTKVPDPPQNSRCHLMIGTNITSIGFRFASYMVWYADDLILPRSIKTIGDMAFYACTNLNGELILPSSLVTIGDKAFSNCTGFTGTLIIPDSVKLLGLTAFSGCTGITKAVIPRGVKMTSIYGGIFEGCTSLATADCHMSLSNVNTLNPRMFRNCTALTEIHVLKSDDTWTAGMFTIGESPNQVNVIKDLI